MGAYLAATPVRRVRVRTGLWTGMWVVTGLHLAVLLLIHPAPVAFSRFLTAAIPLLGVAVCMWRADRLPAQHRLGWRWASMGMLLWALAHAVEAVLGHSVEASNLRVDASDFIYLTATFPLLISMSTTRETESLRSVFVLNCAQIGLAAFLSYFLLYRMSMTQAAASIVMGTIYGTTCVVMSLIALLRSMFWSSEEERRTVLTIGSVIWTYLPIELGMDYATKRWNLPAGTALDLLWSVPFLVGGWMALHLRIDDTEAENPILPGRGSLMVEALGPMLITAGIMALAAAVTRQHVVVGLVSIFGLLALQGAESAIVQVSYLRSRNLLLEQEQKLKIANTALEQLSLQDPLTGIANRRHFSSSLESAWRRAIRKRQPIALLMVDVDLFKAVNDLYGHPYGDQCLVSIAQALNQLGRRPDDVVARMGGEEFVMLLPDTDLAGASTIAEWIHASIQALEISHEKSPFAALLTVSIGIGVASPQQGDSFNALADCADLALYDAKGHGRNRTCSRTLS